MKEYLLDNAPRPKSLEPITSKELVFIGIIFAAGFFIPLRDTDPRYVVWITRLYLLLGIVTIFAAIIVFWFEITFAEYDEQGE